MPWVNWGVRASAGVALLSVTLLTIAAAAVGLVAFDRAADTMDDLAPTRRSLTALTRLYDALEDRASRFPQFALAPAAERPEVLAAALAADRTITAELIDLAALEQVDTAALDRLAGLQRRMAILFEVPPQTAEALAATHDLLGLLAEGRQVIREREQHLREMINAANGAVSQRFGTAQRVLATTVVACLLLAGLIFLYIDRVIVLRLRRLRQGIRAHMAGFPADFACGGRDEIAEVGAALRRLVHTNARRERELNTFRMAVEHSPTTTVITDVQGHIRYVNPKFTLSTGYAAEEALGRTPALLRSGLTPPEQYREMWTTILSGQEWRGQFCNRSRSGQLYWEETRIAPLAGDDGAIGGFVALKEDITERLRIAEELQAAKEAAEASTRAKSEFLAMMSHEIRTPMNGILGMVRLLADTRLSRQQRDFVETVQYSGEALLTILNDILDFSKLEAGKLEVAPIDVDLPRLVASVIELMRSRADEKGLVLSMAGDPGVPHYVRLDPTRLRQVLLNLVGNAIKFTERGRVSLRLGVVGGEPCRPVVRFAVADTGIGIAPEVQERLFSAFAQADGSIARRFGGTGLGLTICKRLVELMEGRIAVDSVEGQGSTFWFELPMTVVDAPASSVAGVPEAVVIPPLAVLLAEDNLVNQKVAVGLLEKRGHRVDLAADGAEAVAKVQAAAYDLVLMDMQMPKVDGLEATRRIRALGGRLADIPIIAMTANALRGDEERCLAAGMDGFVAKPIDPAQLDEALVRHVLRRAPAAPAEARSSALDELRAVLGDSALGALVAEFLRHVHAAREVIGGALTAGDLHAIAAAAHDLKATSATFGLPKLAALVEAIELAARNGQAEETARLAADLPYRIARGERRLAAVMGEAG